MYQDGISVVISSYNALKTLGKCLDAFESQDFDTSKFQVIIVDDGSTDASKALIHEYIAHEKISLVYLFQKNQGAGVARNTGIKQARFDILAYTDADCVPDSNWLSVIYRSIKEEKKMFLGGYTYTDDVVIFPWKNAPAHQVGITANMALSRNITENIFFWNGFSGMLWDDTNFVMDLSNKGIPQIYVPEMKVLHPINILSFERLMIRTKGRQNEVLLYKNHREKVLSCFHPIFQPRFFGRISLSFVLLLCSFAISISTIIFLWFWVFLSVFFWIYLLFHWYFYRYFIVFLPSQDIKISHRDRCKTFFYTLCVLPLYSYYRIRGSIKFRFLMI